MGLNENSEHRENGDNSQKISDKQKKKVWRLIYRLCEIDPSDATPFERLSGAMNKILDASPSPKDPFRGVRKKDATKLVVTLQGYVKSAEKKAKNG